jgi:hypothetical protein
MLVSEMFDNYPGTYILFQEANLFFTKKGFQEDEANLILVFAEEHGLLKSGCADLAAYAERLKRIGKYAEQIEWLAKLGYEEEHGFVEVYAQIPEMESWKGALANHSLE